MRDGANIAALSESLWSTTNASMAALPNLRLAADFEALRDLSDASKMNSVKDQKSFSLILEAFPNLQLGLSLQKIFLKLGA